MCLVLIPDLCTLTYFAQGHNTVTPMRLEPAAPQSQVKHLATEPLCFPGLNGKMVD